MAAEETEVVVDTTLGLGPEAVEPEAPTEYSFNEYSQQISEDFVVTTFGDGLIVDKSGPFDSEETASDWAEGFLEGLVAGDIKPARHVVETWN